MLDNFEHRKYSNANMLILGSSGAGKTYFLQSLALRLREKQTHVFIISPKNGSEFMRACEAIGGSFIVIAPGSKHNINIMELRQKVSGPEELDMDRMTSHLAEKIQKVMGFFYLLMPEITYEEKQVLDEALVDTYAKFGITNDNDSLWDPEHPGRFRPMPTLKDLYETLEELGTDAKRLKNVLARFVTGSASSFSNQTNVSLDNKYVVLDVSRLGDEMIPIGMYVALDYVWDKAREDILTKKAIIMDEGWKLIGLTGSKDSAKFVLNVFKLIRGFNRSGIIASQDLNDFLTANGGEFGRGIINNSEIQTRKIRS